MILDSKLFEPDTISHSEYAYCFKIDEHFIPSNGNTLHGQYLHHQGDTESKGLIIHFHGNAKNITSHITHVDWLPKHGYDVFIFDYSGYGSSSGTPSRKRLVQNGIDILKYIAKNFDTPKKMIVIGQSLGASIACATISNSDTKIDHLILNSAFPSFRQIVKHHIQKKFKSQLASTFIPIFISEKYDLKDTIKKIRSRILVLHGTRDDITPFRFGKEISRLCNCTFWQSDSGHTQLFRESEEFRNKLLLWLDESR